VSQFGGRRVLVTGASGFIGGVLVRHLAGLGAHARAVVRPTSSTAGLALPRVETVVVPDLTDLEAVLAVMRGCDIVVNLAGTVAGTAEQQRTINVDAARTITLAAIECGVSRLVHVSSAGIYGFRTPGDADETSPVDPGPLPYGATKAEGEHVVRNVAAASGLDLSVIRPALVYGAGSAVWTTALYKWARRQPTVFLGDGSGLAPVVHVDDVVNMITVLAEHPAAVREVFNCAADPVPTWRDFLGSYSAIAGHSRWLGIPVAPVHAIARVVSRLSRAGTPAAELSSLVSFLTGQRRFRVDKAGEVLGWRPQVDLQEGMARCVPFLLDQEARLSDRKAHR
jgi:nucleoside-diphosphate-sugar epimerase